MSAWKNLGSLLVLLGSLSCSMSAHACACCLDGMGQYSVMQGVDAYQKSELFAHTKVLRTKMNFGIAESNTVFTNPELVMQQVSTAQNGLWNITLTERDDTSQRSHKVVLRFKPAQAAKWTYIRHTKPLEMQRDTSGLSHDFLIPGTVTVVSDKAGLMKDIRKISAQLTLYGHSNNCFDASSLYAFMFGMTFFDKADASSMSGEGHIK
jgi:hypothetical protein